mgnify:CR=1 FL=1
MKRKTTKRLCVAVSLMLVASLCVGCGGGNAEKVTLNPADYETDETFITFADGTPNAADVDAIAMYRDLGLNTFLLTEDFVPMVEDGTLSSSYGEMIKNIESQGLEVWIRNMYNDEDYFQNDKQKAGSNYGTPYEIGERNITDEFSQYDGVTGFYMADEPFMTTLPDIESTPDVDESLYAAMDKLGKLVEWKNTYYPDKYWHMNHVPSSSWDHYYSYTYQEFLQYYMDNIIAKLEGGGRSICLDRYPLTEGGGVIHDSFLSDILTGAIVTRDYNAGVSEEERADYGICLQTFQDTNLGLRDITSTADITFQMYAGMACGAELFEYFVYRSYEGIGLFGITDEAGEKRIYDYVKEANDKALPFSKVICAFDWKGLTATKGESSGKDDTFASVSDLLATETGVLKSMTSRYDAIAGCFTQGEQDGYMVVNFTAPDLNQTNVVTLDFDGCSQAIVYTSEGVETVNLVDGQLRLTLAAGEGAFIIPA